jgi:phosphoglycerate dehydrogenase-like enzyme
MTTQVLILDRYCEDYLPSLTRAFPDLKVWCSRPGDELAVDPATIEVLIAFGLGVNDQLIRSMNALKWIHSLATGVDYFLRLPSLSKAVLLTSGRGIHGPPMRESVLFMMQAVSRNVARIVANQSGQRWERWRWPMLAGKTAVIVGVGISSTATANLLRAIGMRVVGVSRTPREVAGFDTIVSMDQLAKTVSEADYLINILPGGPQTAGIVGREVFAGMKPSAYFINVGRGDTVDESALIDCLRERRIAGAGLDVFRQEPLPPDSPLWNLPNAFIASHMAGLFEEYAEYATPIIVENMRHYVNGRFQEMRNLFMRQEI